MKRAWIVEMVCHIELIRRGLLCDELLLAKPEDAGPSTIDRIKIRPIDSSYEIGDDYVSVVARGVEL